MTQHGSVLSICHLGKYYPPAPGGIETHVRALARAQAELGADVRVVCVNHSDRRGRDVTRARYGATRTVDELDGPVRVTRLGRSATFARLDVCPALPWIIKELNHHPPDILHLHTPNPTMVLTAASLLRASDTPLIITHHSDIVRQRILRVLHDPFERVVYDRASSILASSSQYVHGSPMLREHEHKVQVVPLGLHLHDHLHPGEIARNFAATLRERYGAIIWLAVGRCVYYKGLHTAIEALPAVPGVLIIVGSGPLEWELRELARQLHVDDRLIWLGNASDDELIGAYHAATALWFPSSARSEAFGLVQVEAMASGCPVINAQIQHSGVAWVSQHEHTGLTVRPNDAGALAAAARRILEEPGLRQQLARQAIHRATTEFDAARMGQRSLDIYRRVVAPRALSLDSARSRLRQWVRQAAGGPEISHASLAPLRGESLRRS